MLTFALAFGCGVIQQGRAESILTLSLDGEVVVDETSGAWSLTESSSDGCAPSLVGSFIGATNFQFMASNPVDRYSSDLGFGTETGTSLQFVQTARSALRASVDRAVVPSVHSPGGQVAVAVVVPLPGFLRVGVHHHPDHPLQSHGEAAA